MDLHLLYILPLVAITGIMIALAVYAWLHRRSTGAFVFMVLVLAVAFWSFSYSFELLSQHPSSKIMWMKLEYVGIVAVPVAWLAFALSYTGSHFATPRVFALLAVEPLVVLLLVWTNEWHGLHWSALEMPGPGAFPAVNVTYGPSFWVHTTYSYACLLAGCAVFVHSFVRSPGRYRRQSGALLVAAAAPFVGNFVYVAGLSPLPQLDPTPFAFAVSGSAMAWALFRFHFLEIAPIAHQAVVEGMRDPVIVLDAHNHITSLNPSAHQIVRQNQAALTGHVIGDVLPWWHEATHRQSALREITLLVEGEQRYYDLQVADLTDKRGTLQGRVAVLHEVTERKLAQDALRTLYEAQSSLVRQLERAKQVADSANTAKTEFISFVSHELKTPMAAVRGYADLMQMGYAGPVSTEQAEYIESIRTNIDTMALLVSDLNDIARLETGQFWLERSFVLVEEIIAQVQRANDSLIQANNHNFVVAIEPNLPFLYGDRTRMIQVLTNLVGNACKYTPSGGTITVRAKRADDGPCVMISVQDTGIGVAPAEQQFLFDKFFRAAEARQRNIPGTGLGLHIAKHLVELHDGTIRAESALGVGTTISVTIPVAEDTQPISALPAELVSLSAA